MPVLYYRPTRSYGRLRTLWRFFTEEDFDFPQLYYPGGTGWVEHRDLLLAYRSGEISDDEAIPEEEAMRIIEQLEEDYKKHREEGFVNYWD